MAQAQFTQNPHCKVQRHSQYGIDTQGHQKSLHQAGYMASCRKHLDHCPEQDHHGVCNAVLNQYFVLLRFHHIHLHFLIDFLSQDPGGTHQEDHDQHGKYDGIGQLGRDIGF